MNTLVSKSGIYIAHSGKSLEGVGLITRQHEILSRCGGIHSIRNNLFEVEQTYSGYTKSVCVY